MQIIITHGRRGRCIFRYCKMGSIHVAPAGRRTGIDRRRGEQYIDDGTAQVRVRSTFCRRVVPAISRVRFIAGHPGEFCLSVAARTFLMIFSGPLITGPAGLYKGKIGNNPWPFMFPCVSVLSIGLICRSTRTLSLLLLLAPSSFCSIVVRVTPAKRVIETIGIIIIINDNETITFAC
jgi:hypothetical protein